MDDWSLLDNADDSPIVEAFDETWPYNFKWGFDGKTKQAHVWRVQGGTDGRPYHRKELEALWGRDVKVREGDILGLASYIPAEQKLDGTVVAPPTVLVQAYYSQEVPPAIFDWFNAHFPGVVVRRARLAAATNFNVVPWPSQNVIKWVWSRNDGLLLWQTDAHGLPNHDLKANNEWGRMTTGGDIIGFATPTDDDKIEIDSYGTAEPRAISAVKDELTKLYPDSHIVSGVDWEEEQGQLHGDPGKLARREAAVAWAQEHLEVPSETPVEAPVSSAEPPVWISGTPGWLSTLLGRKKTAEAAMDGAMVALFLNEKDGKKVVIKGGEPLNQLHVTLLFFTDKAADRDDWDDVQRIVDEVAKQTPPLKGKVSGYGVFTNDVDVLWASPSVQGLAELRHKLFQACEDAGFTVSKDHDWAPHITLKYDHKGKLPKLDQEILLDFSELTFARGDDHQSAKFEGHFEKTTGWGAQEWDGWQGPQHFITDGKEVLTDPTGEADLERRFRQLYPDAERFSTGYAYPTVDDLGYGAWHERGDVPLHELTAVLDKHLEKPTHLVDDWRTLDDPQRYRRGLPS